MIQQWQPWKESTGPKTAKGKFVVSRNAFKGGEGKLLCELARTIRELKKQLDKMEVD